MSLCIVLNSSDIHPRVDKDNQLYLVQVEWDEDGITIRSENRFKPKKEVWPIKQMLLLPLANLHSYTAVIESEEGEWIKWVELEEKWVNTRCPSE